MSELGDHEAIEPPAADAMVARLDEILDDFASAVADKSTVSDAVRIDRIARLEKLRAATAALQVAESVRFAQSQVAEQMTRMGFKAAAACIRKAAYEADREGYVQRGRTERKHRRVGVRPAPGTMAILSGYLPVEQGVACYAALRQHADTAKACGDGRTRDQIMADTLVERLTGQPSAGCECGVADHDAAGGAAGSAQRQTGNHSGLWAAAG